MEKKYKVTNVSDKVGHRIPVDISFESLDGTIKTPIYDTKGKIVSCRSIHLLKAGESVITSSPPPSIEYRFKTEEIVDSEEKENSSVKKIRKKR